MPEATVTAFECKSQVHLKIVNCKLFFKVTFKTVLLHVVENTLSPHFTPWYLVRLILTFVPEFS